MQGLRFHQRQLGKLPPRAVHFLRQTNYDLIARATHGSPAKLRAYAGRLHTAHDELRFRMPGFADFLAHVAGIAEAVAIKKETPRLIRYGSRRTWPLHGLAKFSRKSAARGHT